MNYAITFKKHRDLEGLHSFLSPSSYSWINYDEEKIVTTYNNHLAKQMGTELHEYAHMAITHARKQPKNNDTVNMFINDAIGYGMQSEQPLYYSEFAFGTADAISFKKGLLRIHDLKTGVNTASMKQLYIYAAYFCLEYDVNPDEIKMELRIYQNNDIIAEEPDPGIIRDIMTKIVTFSKILKEMAENS